MTFCTNCGKKLSAGATKCDACGSPIIAVNPTLPEAPQAGNQSNPDALKTQVSNPGAGSEFSTVSNATLPLSVAVGAQSGRLLGGRYKLEQCIGSGGMGEIYRARRTHIGDTVAVKVLRADVVENEKSRQRFYREARAAAMLHHPNAVVIHDFGEDDDGTAYIVMELLVGRSLRQLLVEEGSINSARAYGIIRQASAALDAGHRNGIVHRDIKPDNIILLDSNDGVDHVKILDFGIAKVLDMALDTHSLEQRLTNVGSVIGTPHYMAPEQCQGEEADARSDIYSLGVVLYELLTGVAPFLAKTPTGVAIKHVTEKPRPLREINPSVPESVERIVLHSLEKDPNTRPQTALEFAREFESALASEPDTIRFGRSGEQARVDTLKFARPGASETAQKNLETVPQGAAAPPQSYETRITPPSATDHIQQSSGVVTGQLKQSDEAATEFISRAKVTAKQEIPEGGASRGIADSDLAAQALLPTEMLQKSEATKPAPIAPVEGGKSTRITALYAEEEPAKRAEPDPARTGPISQPGRFDEAGKKKTAPIAAPPKMKPAAVPAAKSKIPLLIGAGVVLVVLIGAGALLFKSGKSETGTRTDATASPSPGAATAPSPSASSAYPDIAAPEGMVYVIGGVLRAGRDDGDANEKPAHVVNVKPFFIDRTEVTSEQYQKFIDATGYAPPPSWQGARFPEGTNTLPVTDVTWEDASAYAKWAGKRLPTEEEWEFAARGPDERRVYPWGEEWIADASNTKSDDNDKRQLAPVGQFPKGASPFGLLDMSGNAWEWTASEFKEYPGGKVTPPVGYKNLKVIRGGTYDSPPKFATATLRRPHPATRGDWPNGSTPDYAKTGFRLAQDAKNQ
ncbi:MAG: SUMF1/EgtB/PvdO family nonheme iron enzyme [Blastocatellia bacterium]